MENERQGFTIEGNFGMSWKMTLIVGLVVTGYIVWSQM